MEKLKKNSNADLKFSIFLPQQKVQCSIIANVLFGSPNMRCAGHGICRITQVEEECLVGNSWSPCRTIAQVNKETKGHYSLQVLKSTVSTSLYNRQFAGRYFQIDEDFDMRAVFQSFESSFIRKGQYQFVEGENFIHIDFSTKMDE